MYAAESETDKQRENHLHAHHEKKMGTVDGIILDSSVLFPSQNDAVDTDDAVLCSSADPLLRRLRYSKIPLGISREQGLSSSKERLLQEIATLYSCSIFGVSEEASISTEVAQIWGNKAGSVVHVISSFRRDLYQVGNNSGWLQVVVGSAEKRSCDDVEHLAVNGTSRVSICKLEELPLVICQLNKKAHALCKDLLTVGYVMKPSREEDFSKRGAFPLCPSENGMMFLPLNYELPISSQLKLVDAVLHKATDEILYVDMGSSSLEFHERVTFSRNLQELQRCLKCQLDCCVIDPFESILPILDRVKIQHILTGLQTLHSPGRHTIRGPRFLKVDRFDESNLEQKLAKAQLFLPNIVKPQVACGVADAHSMAIVFQMSHYKDLNVPLPAVVQEYVDHSSLIYKFYALGSKCFYAVKKSIPNADTLMNLFTAKGLEPLHFDSLKSLPVAKEQLNTENNQLDVELVMDAAHWLRRELGLTVFGFDVVVQEGTGDHVIVDVNYLPSFKEVPDDVAIPAFWDALKEKITSKTE